MPPPASAGGRDSESASRYCSPCEAGAIYNKIADVRVCFCPPPGGIPSHGDVQVRILINMCIYLEKNEPLTPKYRSQNRQRNRIFVKIIRLIVTEIDISLLTRTRQMLRLLRGPRLPVFDKFRIDIANMGMDPSSDSNTVPLHDDVD